MEITIAPTSAVGYSRVIRMNQYIWTKETSHIKRMGGIKGLLCSCLQIVIYQSTTTPTLPDLS